MILQLTKTSGTGPREGENVTPSGTHTVAGKAAAERER